MCAHKAHKEVADEWEKARVAIKGAELQPLSAEFLFRVTQCRGNLRQVRGEATVCQAGGGQEGRRGFAGLLPRLFWNVHKSRFVCIHSTCLSLSPPANGVSRPRGGVELWGGDGIIQQSGMREGDASTIFFATRTEPEQCHRDFRETNLNSNGTWRKRKAQITHPMSWSRRLRRRRLW